MPQADTLALRKVAARIPQIDKTLTIQASITRSDSKGLQKGTQNTVWTGFASIFAKGGVNMNPSTLSEQVVDRKKGRIISPLMAGLENKIFFNSWSLERVPEYIWFALILDAYGRETGLQYCSNIVGYIANSFPNIHSSKMSSVIKSDNIVQQQIYNKILSLVNTEVLSPLTAVIDREISIPFFKSFYCPSYPLENRIQKLESVTKKYYSPQSHEATDVRYLAVLYDVLCGKLDLLSDGPDVDAMKHYPTTPHDSEIMKLYSLCIRNIESVQMPDDSIDDFVNIFWKRMSKMTDCTLAALKFKKDGNDYKDFLEKTKEALNYINVRQKEESVSSDKFSVVFGSLTYAFKTFAEVVDHDLGNTIIGRQSARIIIEVYILMKYLFLKEADIPDIWKKYKAYGIGKYKLILLKLREGMGNDTSHVVEPILYAVVNEPLLEEFTEIDLKYFDKQAIREKAMSVGEKDLYDVAYDYDSSYAHGLWGAVRESSMLSCGNVFHNYHSVPDATDAQHLADVTSDCHKYLTKLLLFVNDSYNMPKWYLDYLEEFQND
ncbi:MAG TPA: DUF5677 domain-containing protein [Oscillospiraceae bacterium]|nr:DUF5677 domain-containing protein [Oscillospiraceae bacterium]